MSDVDSWLSARRPASPFELAATLREKVSSVEEQGMTMADTLSATARACLQQAQSRSRRTREAAFHLLTADALVTYACEAALESADSDATLDATLMEILRVGEGS